MIYLINTTYYDKKNSKIIDLLKIGYTSDLDSRLKAYLTTNPEYILLQTREGDTKIESYLHKKFEKYRYKDSKEWFYYDQEIIDDFQCELVDLLDADKLLEQIKKDIRSKISSVVELKEKYLNQILEEVKSLDDFSEELYDEEKIISNIVDIWENGINQFNKGIDNISLKDYIPINLFNCDSEIEIDIISQDLPQILGRQRLFENPWKNQATFYYKLTCDYRKTSKEVFESSLNVKIQKSKNLLVAFEASPDIAKKDLATKYLRVADMDNYRDDYVAVNTHGGTYLKPVFNNLVYVSELRAFDIQQIDYKDRFSVFSTINANLSQLDMINLELEQFFSEYEKLTIFRDKLKYICEFNFSSEDLFRAVVDQVDTELQSAILGLGKKKLKSISYNSTFIRKELGIVLFNSADLSNHIRSTFSLGDKFTLSDIKIKLGELYERIGYKKTPKANDILDYFEVKEYMVTLEIDGVKKRVRGYELIGYKK